MNTLNLPEGTVVLEMDSPSLAKAIVADMTGLQPGDQIEFITPQFECTDGMQVPVPVDFDDWENLHKKDDATLTALGFGVWDETEHEKHWLFPKEWYDIIPDGYQITSIFREQETFKRGETDNDYRFGCLSFGFIQKFQSDSK